MLDRGLEDLLPRWLWASYSEQGASVAADKGLSSSPRGLLHRAFMTWQLTSPRASNQRRDQAGSHSTFYDPVSEVAVTSALFCLLRVTKSKPHLRAGEAFLLQGGLSKNLWI